MVIDIANYKSTEKVDYSQEFYKDENTTVVVHQYDFPEELKILVENIELLKKISSEYSNLVSQTKTLNSLLEKIDMKELREIRIYLTEDKLNEIKKFNNLSFKIAYVYESLDDIQLVANNIENIVSISKIDKEIKNINTNIASIVNLDKFSHILKDLDTNINIFIEIDKYKHIISSIQRELPKFISIYDNLEFMDEKFINNLDEFAKHNLHLESINSNISQIKYLSDYLQDKPDILDRLKAYTDEISKKITEVQNYITTHTQRFEDRINGIIKSFIIKYSKKD